MKRVSLFGIIALVAFQFSSCKKCYTCTREKYCYTCISLTDTTDKQIKCADKGQSKDDFDSYISTLSTGYTCVPKIYADKDQNDICDGSMLSTYTGVSIDKTQLEMKGWSCAQK